MTLLVGIGTAGAFAPGVLVLHAAADRARRVRGPSRPGALPHRAGRDVLRGVGPIESFEGERTP